VTVPVTIIACLYGDSGHADYIDEWAGAIHALDPAPERVVVATDRSYSVPGADVIALDCQWHHPNAFYLQVAALEADTEWIWYVELDDLPLLDALDGIEDVDADVWLMGYQGERIRYVPTAYPNAEYLARPGNQYPAGSSLRRLAFNAVGGFDDIGYQDWGLWRKLALNGATFEASGRVNYKYRLPHTRTNTEFNPETRRRYHHEMMLAEDTWSRLPT
jgi:hypothetical protein